MSASHVQASSNQLKAFPLTKERSDDISNPFTWINSINSRKNLFETSDANPEALEKAYNPFMTNRGLSYYPDTILYANEMNQAAHLDKKLQYSYLLNSIRPGKRFSKWAKKKENGDLEVVMEYFGYGPKKAAQALSVLTQEQITDIKEQMRKGGTK